jgi:hypothetical protein
VKKEHSIALPKGDASRGGTDFWEAVLPGFLVALLPTFGACCLRNKSTRLACNMIEERLSRVQRLHHGQQLRLGEERPGEVETANQALAFGGLQ